MLNRFRQVSFAACSIVLSLLLQPLIHCFSSAEWGREASDPGSNFKGNLARTLALNHLSTTVSNNIITGSLFSLQEDFWSLSKLQIFKLQISLEKAKIINISRLSLGPWKWNKTNLVLGSRELESGKNARVRRVGQMLRMDTVQLQVTVGDPAPVDPSH